jgi:ribosomal protein L37AE/L43A
MSAKPEVVCPKCKASVAMRISRTGFWERKVLGRLGIYPWKCGACGVKFRRRKRGVRSRA